MSGSLASLVGRGETLVNALSGAAGGVNRVLSAFGTGLQLPFGAAGPITLGAFVFEGFEVPESVSWGGAQALTIHKLPGGARVIDAMGRDDRPLDWSGIFLGPGAADRARALDRMRISGQPIPLVFNGNYIPAVVIATFEADERRSSHVPYRISCIPLVVENTRALPSLFGSIVSDINDAVGFDAFQAVSGAASAAASVVGAMMALTGGNPVVYSTYAALTNAAALTGLAAGDGFHLGSQTTGAAITGLQTAQTGIAAEIAPTGFSTTLVGRGISSIADLASVTTQAGILAQVTGAAGYVGRALKNAVNGQS